MSGGGAIGDIVAALAPIFLLIVVGWTLRRTRLVGDAFWPAAETLTYYVFFPCLLFLSLARADLDWLAVAPMAGALAGAILLTAAACRLSLPLWGQPGPSYTSVFQGAIRANSYVALAAAFNLFGAEGVTLAAIAIATVVPLVNLLSVLTLARHGDKADGSLRGILRSVVTNPLIIAVVAGAVWSALSLPVPPVVGPTMEILSRAALPLGLMAVGAGLSLAAARRDRLRIGLSVAGKLVLAPLLTLVLCLAFGVGGPAAAVAVLYNANPTAASSYVLARQMGGDAPLLAGIITVGTLAAGLSIPLVVVLMRPIISWS